ncbi:MAG TPA: anti-virulence regulator CigR family protein [Longimicrobiales bacterium]|nr:anti-virulence regulator CigR family protein [Longimicrobiales bacterium]
MRWTTSAFWVIAVATALLLGTARDLDAQGRSDRRSGGDAVVEISGGITFSLGERERIVAWYSDHASPSVETLPPGIRKNLARGKPIPPGLARRMLPNGLESRLPVYEGYQRVQVGVDVLLVEIATGIIHDVLMDVIR